MTPSLSALSSNSDTIRRRAAVGFRPIVVAVAVAAAVASPASAQTGLEPRRDASFTAGASFGDGDTALASSVGLGFRFSRRLGVEVELAHARRLDFTVDLCPAPRVCVLGGQLPVTGRSVSLVPALAIELLPRSHRLRAFVRAGAGGGHIRQRYMIGPSQAGVEATRSSLVAALTFGAGARLPISQRLAIGTDIRLLHLFDDEASLDSFITPAGILTTLRVGSQVTWRF
jgi:opacity protein-like surface antigen